jgi:hypothetical protein
VRNGTNVEKKLAAFKRYRAVVRLLLKHNGYERVARGESVKVSGGSSTVKFYLVRLPTRPKP